MLRPCGDAGSLDVSAGVLWSQVVSVIRGFEVRQGRSSPIETEVRRKKGAWIRKMETNTKARVLLQLLCDTYSRRHIA